MSQVFFNVIIYKYMPMRVLHILNNLGSGGVEGLLMNIYRVMDRERVQFDFMIRSAKDNRFADEVERLGGACLYHA